MIQLDKNKDDYGALCAMYQLSKNNDISQFSRSLTINYQLRAEDNRGRYKYFSK